MADRSISELPTASAIGATDLFVLQQANAAKKLTGQALENWLLQMADGHGGIQSISKTSSTGSNPVVDTYTITFADTTTSTFTVTNGLKGDTGDQTYVHIKYAARNPQVDSDLADTPDKWIGMYVGLSATAPTTRASYKWYLFKGDKGDTGAPASISSKSVQYQTSTSGTVIPTGTWQDNIPTVTGGHYLWTRVRITYNTGDIVTSYSVGYKGTDGTGAGDMTKLVYDPLNAVATAGGIPAFVGEAVSSVSQLIPAASSANPLMDGDVNPGSANNYSRADHVHPSDTSKADSDLSNVSSGAVKTAMLDAGVVTAVKIAANAVTREKLANDTLYSPIVMLSGNVNLGSSHLGKTLIGNYSSSSATRTITLTQAISTSLPLGFEVAVCRPFNYSNVNIAFNGLRLICNGTFMRTAANRTASLPELGTMIALKKIETHNTNGDLWLITGNVEVV